ncbi:FMN-binding protein [Algiphilus sp.]|uniref:FMN-binding protein n=1 Tax=Algiphilus sp. TaxID=1872431 RepID=UPI002A60E71D|nr:FMN-binding protein [Pseudomonadota bacterium]
MQKDIKNRGEQSSPTVTARPPPRRLAVIDLLGIAALCVGMAIVLLDYITNVAQAEEKFEFYIYFQEPDAFLAQHLGPDTPPPQVLNIDSAAQERIRAVYGRPFPKPRLYYWAADGKTAWIFDDIGKEGYQPTTSGFVVEDGQIVAARVLTYRESRGEEVGEGFFLEQIEGARAEGQALDQPVDNISGATESVEMMKRMALTAIVFDSLVN